MTVECANCGSTTRVDAVCHHCGKPLCHDAKCRVEADDSAFGSAPGVSASAVHCLQCWQEAHEAGRGRRSGGTR